MAEPDQLRQGVLGFEEGGGIVGQAATHLVAHTLAHTLAHAGTHAGTHTPAGHELGAHLAGVCYARLTAVEQERYGFLTTDRQPKRDPALVRWLVRGR